MLGRGSAGDTGAGFGVVNPKKRMIKEGLKRKAVNWAASVLFAKTVAGKENVDKKPASPIVRPAGYNPFAK